MDEETLRADCVKAFRNATQTGQEKLSREDYKVAVLELLGYKPSKYEIASVWNSIGGGAEEEEGAGLGLDSFVSMMMRRLQEKDRSELVREIFVTLDAHQRGFLTEQDCLAAFKQVAPQLQQERVRALFREVDSNLDGRVSYRDFEIMMNALGQQIETDNT